MLPNQPQFQSHEQEEEITLCDGSGSGKNVGFGTICLSNWCLLSTCYLLTTFVSTDPRHHVQTWLRDSLAWGLGMKPLTFLKKTLVMVSEDGNHISYNLVAKVKGDDFTVASRLNRSLRDCSFVKLGY